jgi:hypothetical protein
MSERERFIEQLPFFVNGTLAPTDAAWMREQLQQHPELQGQLGFHEALDAHLRASVDASVQGVAADVGYASVAARIAAERTPPHTAPAWWTRIGPWVTGSATAPGWRLAQGAAMGLALGLGTMLAWQAQQRPDYAAVRSTAPGLADGPLLRVSFQPQATETELRLALIESRALIVAGPTRLGDYYIKAAAGRQAATLEALRRSNAVQQADEVPGLPEDLLE